MNYSLFDQTQPIVSKEKEKVVIQALRLLISFTTLNKFCGPLTTVKNMQRVLCKEPVVLGSLPLVYYGWPMQKIFLRLCGSACISGCVLIVRE